MSEDTTIVIKPREALKPYLSRKQRYACLVIHRRFGKTFGCIQDIGAKALTCKREHLPKSRRNLKSAPLRYAYIAPTREQAKDVAWAYMKEFFGVLPGVVINESELMVTLPNRARIRLYSGENYERMRGLYFDGIIMDEYADIDPSAWALVIRPCLSDYKGWATFIGTPKGKNAFYEVFKHAESDPEWYSLLLKASESGVLDEEELQDIQNDPNITRNQYLQEYECDFTIANPGAIFLDDVEQARKEGRISNDIAHVSGVPVYSVFDIGLPMNTKCWIFQVVGDKIKHLQMLSGSQTINTPSKWTNLLTDLGRQRNYSWGVHFLPHDGETVWRPSFVEAGMTNVEVLKRPPDEWDSINAAKRMFNRTFIHEDECAEGIRALENWSSKQVQKKQYWTNKPNHDMYSHPSTAFSYAAWAVSCGRCISGAGQNKANRRRASGVKVRMGTRGVASGNRYNGINVIK
jgi:hypothetical protein